MKGLYCRAGVSDAEPKFVIQETVGLCFCPSAVHYAGGNECSPVWHQISKQSIFAAYSACVAMAPPADITAAE